MPLAYFHPYPYHFEAVKFCVELGYSYTCDDATCLALHALIFQLSKHVNMSKIVQRFHPQAILEPQNPFAELDSEPNSVAAAAIP